MHQVYNTQIYEQKNNLVNPHRPFGQFKEFYIFGILHFITTHMKKTTTTLLALLALTFYSHGQAQGLISHSKSNAKGESSASISINKNSVSPLNKQSVSKNINPGNQVQSIFDIQFNYPISIGAGVSCTYTGTEFWVGQWNADSMFTLDPGGNITSAFKITGVGVAGSGVRAMTYDGTFIYASVNTTSIKKIDPATKTLVGTITAPTPVRGLSYDSTANGGAGGFWISNFSTDFTLISMTGTVLETITIAEHGVFNVYGIAFDPYTSGGPYLWTNGYGSSGDSAKIQRIHIPTHTNTHLIHNLWNDVVANTAIGGGLNITWRYDPMNYTMMGCTQDAVNHLFGYELADYTPPAVDAECNSVDFFPPYLLTPTFEISPLSWEVKLINNGTDPIADLATTFILDDGSSSVYAPAAFHTFGFTQGSSTLANFGNFTPPPVPQAYTATASVSTTGQTDQDASNDISTYDMAITDTVMARDNGNPTGSLGLPDGSAGVLGQVFEIPSFAYISSATFLLRSPAEGEIVSVDLYNYNGLPDAVIASTASYTITAADTNGVVLTLPFTGGPVPAASGPYFLGVNQSNFNITLGSSSFNWRADATYFQFSGSAWQTVESNTSPFIICYILRMNLLDPSISIVENNSRKFEVYPNPASSRLFINATDGTAKYDVELFDMIGNKVLTASSSAASQTELNISGLSKGMYILKTIVDGNSSSTKISIN